MGRLSGSYFHSDYSIYYSRYSTPDPPISPQTVLSYYSPIQWGCITLSFLLFLPQKNTLSLFSPSSSSLSLTKVFTLFPPFGALFFPLFWFKCYPGLSFFYLYTFFAFLPIHTPFFFAPVYTIPALPCRPVALAQRLFQSPVDLINP